MAERTITVSADRSISTGKAQISVRFDTPSCSFTSEPGPYHTPLFVTRDQAYYWTREWQEGEAEALAELERGEGVVFEDPKEAVRWLHTPEDSGAL